MDTLEQTQEQSAAMEQIRPLVRPNILALQPYSSARDEAPQMPVGTDNTWLDANENALGSPLEGYNWHRYPKTIPLELRSRIAALRGAQPEQIYIGNGSDEAIDMLYRVFCTPERDHAVIMPPTYGMYGVQAAIHGTPLRKVPLSPDFQVNTAAVLAACDAQSKLLFICSPNNPSGQLIDPAAIEDLLAHFPGIVVLDEAYIDFAPSASWVRCLDAHPRLIILQTLSKAWGLAGLRVGIAIAHPYIIGLMNKIKYPYNMNSAVVERALEALQQEAATQDKISLLNAERLRLTAALAAMQGLVAQVFPSDANFILVKMAQPADQVYQYLAQNGIIVRNRSKEMHCENCLRITVGTPEENTRLLGFLERFFI